MTESMRATLGQRAFNRKFRDVHAKNLLLLNPDASSGHCHVECLHCGNEFTMTPANAIHSRRKCSCRYEKTGPKIGTIDDWQTKLDAKHGRGEYVILESPSKDGYRSILHSCGIEFTARVSSLLRSVLKGTRCPCTYKKPTTTKELHLHELKTLHGGRYRLVQWGGAGKPLHTYLHATCGQQMKQRRLKLKSYDFCPHCHGPGGNHKNRITREQVQASVDTANPLCDYKVVKFERIPHRHKRGAGLTQISYLVEHTCGTRFWAGRELRNPRTQVGRCPTCVGRYSTSRDVQTQGRWFRVRGYEETTLRELLTRYHVDDILMQGHPRYRAFRWTTDAGRRTRYVHDFYVPSRRLVVETKSLATAGLVNDDNYWFGKSWPHLQAKARMVLSRGFAFELCLYVRSPEDGFVKVHIPSDWLSISKFEMARRLGIPVNERMGWIGSSVNAQKVRRLRG